MRRIIYFLRRSCIYLVVALAIGAAPGCSKKSKVARHLSRANRYFGGKKFEDQQRAILAITGRITALPARPIRSVPK